MGPPGPMNLKIKAINSNMRPHIPYINPNEIVMPTFSESPFLGKSTQIDKQFGCNLPHWTANGKVQFITFRLADSLPQEILHDIKVRKEIFLKKYPQPWDRDIQRLYSKEIGRLESKFLDKNMGECLLRNPEIRKIVEETILFYNHHLYEALAYVLMPNHVHLLFYHTEGTIDNVVGRIKSFSARKINSKLERQGPVWFLEYFDRMIRSQQHLINTVEYISANPRFLQDEDFTLYVNKEKIEELLS